MARDPKTPSVNLPIPVTTIIFEVRSVPAALYKVLGGFATNGINLTKLESRPAKKGTDFKYVFYIDFEGHFLNSNFQIILKRYEENIKLLGSYPRMI